MRMQYYFYIDSPTEIFQITDIYFAQQIRLITMDSFASDLFTC